MNANEPTTDAKAAGADLDRLLSAFFQSELPAPFPPAPRPEASAKPMPAARRPAYNDRSAAAPRVALAASVALLLGGFWALSDGTTDVRTTPKIGVDINNGSADTKPMKNLLPPKDGNGTKPMP